MRREGRHELSCATCGAPLRELKAIPCTVQDHVQDRAQDRPKPRRAPAPHPYDTRGDRHNSRPNRRRKRRKLYLRDALEKIWDVVEDTFD